MKFCKLTYLFDQIGQKLSGHPELVEDSSQTPACSTAPELNTKNYTDKSKPTIVYGLSWQKLEYYRMMSSNKITKNQRQGLFHYLTWVSLNLSWLKWGFRDIFTYLCTPGHVLAVAWRRPSLPVQRAAVVAAHPSHSQWEVQVWWCDRAASLQQCSLDGFVADWSWRRDSVRIEMKWTSGRFFSSWQKNVKPHEITQ